MSIIKKGKNIIGVYKGSTPISKIYKGDLSVFELNVVYNVTATFNVTSTTEPTKIANGNAYAISGFTKMCVDGVKVPVTDTYTFDTLGEHTVQYKLTDETTFANAAFSDCTSLTEIEIPDGVTSISNCAFSGCTSLSSITCLATTAPTLGTDVFDNASTNGTLYVPQGSDYSTWTSVLTSWTIQYI